MPVIKLSETTVAKLKAPDPSGKQVLYWDKSLRGFGVLVSGATNAKSYVVQQALKGGRTRRVTVARTNVISLTEATERAKELLAVFYQGRDPKAGRRGEATLRSAFQEYLIGRPGLKASSVTAYRENLSYLDSWLDTPLRDITRTMVEDKLREIAKRVAAGGRYNGNSAANGAMVAFRAIYNFAADRAPPHDPMPTNPVRLRKIWLPVAPRTRTVAVADLPRFYAAACALQNAVQRDYVKILLFTGLRRREAAGLRWEHVDFDERVIRLPALSTKASRALNLPMTNIVIDILSVRRALGDAGWVFPSVSRSGHIEEPRFAFDLIRDASGINVSAHDLRRVYASAAEAADLSLTAIKALMNHSLGTGVTESYIQIGAQRLRDPAQRVADKLCEWCEIDRPL
jgi:integrase